MLINNKSTLNILLANDNKVLKEVLKQADSKALEQLVNDKSASTTDVLKNLLSQLKDGNKTNFNLEQLLKNANLFKDLGSFSKHLDSLIKNLNTDPTLTKFKAPLENFLKDIQNLDSKVLKEQLNNSGVFLESKLNKEALNPKLNQNINLDMKTILLQMQGELENKSDVKTQELFKQVEKMLNQIDYHQLLSLTSNSNNVYIPFFWEMLEEGSIEIKENNEEKFYCQIHLTLKEFGKVDLMLALYDKNKLDLNIKAQNNDFKNLVQDNLQNLRQKLNSIEIIPMNINLLDYKQEDDKKEVFTNPYENQLSSGIDIRV